MITPALSDFRSRYCLHEPRWVSDPREVIRVSDLKLLRRAPADGIQTGVPPTGTGEGERGTNSYLWVIDDGGIPYVIEVNRTELDGYRPRHTNLTAGLMAYMGGELWFGSGISLWVSGGSGRYPPACAGQLRAAVRVFESFGYSVRSLGWDCASGTANRVLRES